MADKRFFSQQGPFTLSELASIAEAEIGGNIAPEKAYIDIATLSEATGQHVSFLDNKRYIDAFINSKSGACLIHPDLADRAPTGMALLITRQPYHGYARVAAAYHPYRKYTAEIHPTAIIAESASLGSDVSIDAGVVVSDNVIIADDTRIGVNTLIDRGVSIGRNCDIGSNITLQYCDIGERVIIHPGVRIGQDGYGFALGAGEHLKVPQLGKVKIENDVEIGANTAIDRGTGPDTVVGTGTKIDNMVQIAHNVKIGKGCIIVAQVGISGSTTIGDYVMIGGQAGLAGHLEIGDGVQIAAQSGIMRNIAAGSKVGGSPAQPMREWFRSIATLERLARKKKG